MTNFNTQDDQQSAGQFKDFAGGAEQEFTYTEARKPINRNMIVLILIAAVGGSMIFLMYLRGRFNADAQTQEQIEVSKQVTDFMANAPQSIKTMEAQLDKTEKTVAALQTSHAVGQVPASELKLNPFAFGEKQPAAPKSAMPSVDPMEDVNRALTKVKVEMIVYSGPTSSVQINNWVYKIGDKVTVDSVNFTVKSISRTGVTLRHALGQEYTVTTASAKGL